MSHFEGGPANGVVLQLHRAPIVLRVVTDGTKWDALDQLDDKPEPNETVHVYVMVKGTISRYHLLARDRKATGWYENASYRPCKLQPKGNEDWSKWCESNREEIMKEYNE